MDITKRFEGHNFRHTCWLKSLSDAWIFQSGVFCANNDTTDDDNRLLHPLRMGGGVANKPFLLHTMSVLSMGGDFTYTKV